MKIKSVLLAGAVLTITACAGSGTMKKEAEAATTPAIKQAQMDLKAAKAMNSEWLLLDKATGGSAVSLTKLLKAATAAAEKGDMTESDRLAHKVSHFAKLGTEQSKRYAGSMPFYNN